jgi:hypothetical protein
LRSRTTCYWSLLNLAIAGMVFLKMLLPHFWRIERFATMLCEPLPDFAQYRRVDASTCHNDLSFR